jgi:hypothetical protein
MVLRIKKLYPYFFDIRAQKSDSLTLSILPMAEIKVSILLLDILVTKSFPVNVLTPKKNVP